MAGIFKYLSEWISENFPSAEDTDREIMRSEAEARARSSARHIEYIIDLFEDEVSYQYPHRTDIITVVKKFRQAIYDEHGRVSPYSLLCQSRHFTPEGEIAFDKVVERWSDWTKVAKEFAFLKGYSPSGEYISVRSPYPIASTYDTEEHAVDTALAMKKWHVDRYGTALD
ncbi:hypothetical protein MGYG_08287 [Nannizzia gypsea CBS 118893]|uniref:Uncharacterized protein n=1 Tax=Arthroderma gypseum (strain ATCC MYA-4604 / CBS 118893) TaxID=535722 RepID=E4V693_ARTGP|nr:hypothetical protein MGYG_08287 [Nannizzia gypsea CBS 118893]EFR05276.1 hypothetical protein MGYG_08287 [Nannizzia gypsea CBS 118893]